MSSITTICFQRGQRRKITHCSHGTDLAAVERFIQQIAPYSNAAITKIALTKNKLFDGQEQSSLGMLHVGLLAKFHLRSRENNKLYEVDIPAPVYEIFESPGDQNWQVKYSVGQAITEFYNDLSGEAFDFEEGWLWGRAK